MWQWMPRRRDGERRRRGQEVYRESGKGRRETERRWVEVVGRRWRRARHSMTCHVPTLPLTPPSRVSTPPSLTPRSCYNLLLPPFPCQGCVCVYMENTRVRPLISRRELHSYPAASSYEVFVPACLESRRQIWRAHALVPTILTLRSIRLSLDYIH